MAAGMFRDTEQLGDFTTTSIESYWVGFGLTGDSAAAPAARHPCPIVGLASDAKF
jgi:hypothetical protein